MCRFQTFLATGEKSISMMIYKGGTQALMPVLKKMVAFIYGFIPGEGLCIL
jgi:hypothetical protein